MYIEKVIKIIDDNGKTIRDGDFITYINKEDLKVVTGIISCLELEEIGEDNYLSFIIEPKNSEKILGVNKQHTGDMYMYKYDNTNFQKNVQVIIISE